MTRYVAHVTQVLRTIHKLPAAEQGEVNPVADLPLPERIEIELEGDAGHPCMMYRYNDTDGFCGDTWHPDLKSAFAQAEFEYGLKRADFARVEEPE